MKPVMRPIEDDSERSLHEAIAELYYWFKPEHIAAGLAFHARERYFRNLKADKRTTTLNKQAWDIFRNASLRLGHTRTIKAEKTELQLV
jgi:hypothetical protein